MDVEAHLQRDGALRVRERQQLVFDGDWNGGERHFGGMPHHSITMESIKRVENGREIALEYGDLSDVDQYQLVNGRLYRWRSRKPTDPPFENRELTYVLEYTWHNVLAPIGSDGQRFRLEHDFGLPARTGSIGRYTLKLDFDPVWNMPPIAETRTDVPPGEGLRVARDLYYTGAVWPDAVERPVPWWLGWTALLFYAAGAAFLVRRFLREERRTGRFDPLPVQFEESLLQWKPEIAGAIWDNGVGAPEVAATLARMAQEKKITTRAEDKVLYMHLEVPRESLESYERLLVDKLFFDGDDTSTERVKTHYKSTGLNPSAVIRPRIEWELSQIAGWNVKVRRAKPLVHALLLPACALGLLVAGLAGHADDIGLAMGMGFLGLIFGGLASIAAWRYSRSIAELRPAFVVPGLLLMMPLIVFAMSAVQAPRMRIGAPILFMVPLWLLAVLNLVLDMMKIRDSPEILGYRRRIAGTRQFFIRELQKQQPDLRDEWFPYVLAFGLGAHVDHWFRAFGGAASHVGGFATSSSSFSSSSSSSSSSSGWTGGGGAFGGAGATGTWGLAAAALASGVAAPSSRSGGGGGGGSSSGGGGGGGW
ncbi:MAG TPA: hypothetical protein VF266_04050 [Thermoanaerobaculia bacterium]